MTSFDSLLTVQAHDTAADQLRHRRDTLPERGDLARTEDELAALEATSAEVAGRRNEIARRQQRLEDEVASIAAKAHEIDRKLYSGTVSAPRELQAMQADIDALKRRQSSLEDDLLETMEELEPLDGELARLDADRARLDREGSELRARIAEAEVAIDAELAVEEEARARAAADLPATLTSLYEQLRAKLGGIGAARLEPGGRCGGCHLTLPAAEYARIKREPPDSLYRCEQCGRILVQAD